MSPLQQLQLDPAPALREIPISPLGSHLNNNTSLRARDWESLAVPSVKTPRTVRVALAGCGVVGGGLVRLLHESAPAIASRFGVRFDLTSVLVRDVNRERNLPLEARLFTNNLDGFLRHDADVVIEAVGGDEPARTIVSDALRRGKKAITANKELVSSHGDALSALATENRAGLDFGAAVGGSAPVISTLRDLVGASTPLSVGFSTGRRTTSSRCWSGVRASRPLSPRRASVVSPRRTAHGTWTVGMRRRSSRSSPGSLSVFVPPISGFAGRRWSPDWNDWSSLQLRRMRASVSLPSVVSSLNTVWRRRWSQ